VALASFSRPSVSAQPRVSKPFIPEGAQLRDMAKEQSEVRELQEGNYVMIEDAACKINSYSTAKPGKHGSAKARIEAEGVFDGKKRSLSQPVDAKIWIPIIERKQGQVVSVESDTVAQVMDLETYETITIQTPEDANLSPDDEIEYLEMEDQRKILE
jgi:translation initiation factor 5A